ncbi:putative glycosyltransferase [Sulfolobales Beppu virus 1]|nr:putative glycosyltransferase [Sulfolobales Beppu virus 1]
MWRSFLARSTLKVRDDLVRKTTISNKLDSYMGVFDPNRINKHQVLYLVVEWVLRDDEIIYINKMAQQKPIIFASYWSRFLARCYNCPVVHHEVSEKFEKLPLSQTKYDQFNGFSIFFQLIRKNPDIVKEVIAKVKKGRILIVSNDCSWMPPNTPHVCLPKFGLVSEMELKSMMYNKYYLWLSGGEGFGLPPLEASYLGSPPIAFPVMPLTEWYPSDLKRFLIPDKLTKIEGIYQGGVLHPMARPTDVGELVKFIEDMLTDQPTSEEKKALSDYIKDNYTGGKQYRRIDEYIQQKFPQLLAVSVIP